MQLNDKVQHVYLVGAKSLGAYGGYETFVYKLTEYHQNKENIKYHVACKANGDGCMDIDNAKVDLGYKPEYTYLKYLKDYKKEQGLKRFDDLWKKL